MKNKKLFLVWIVLFNILSFMLKAQQTPNEKGHLSAKQKSLITIAAFAARGDLQQLDTALHGGLDAGLTVSQGKEALVHLYAYAGFPRSIRALQTFMGVLEERKSNGIHDSLGIEASSINETENKYQRGKHTLEELTGLQETGRPVGYGAFAPIIDVFLKEHLFADIFGRDVLSYAERELVTVSVLSSIGGVEPMLQSHLKICLRVGFSAVQLQQFVDTMRYTVGQQEADAAQKVLDMVLADQKQQ